MSIQEYAVGGFVRDLLKYGKKGKDLDIVVTGIENFNGLRKYVLSKGCSIFQERPEFLVIRANHAQFGGVDYTLPRTDGNYSDGRRPDEVFSSSLEEDLSRRDFTMNAIAMNLEDNSIVDPFNGQEDLRNNVLNFVGDPQERLQEDGLRFFRALRFMATMNLALSDSSHKALFAYRFDFGTSFEEKIKNVSSDRIKDEFYKMSHKTTAMFNQINRFALLDLLENRGISFIPTLKRR